MFENEETAIYRTEDGGGRGTCRPRACAALLLIGLLGCAAPEPQGQPAASSPRPNLPKLTVGIQVSPAMTLVMVAEDGGFFDRAGVDVEIKEFTAGKFALQAFLGGSLDIAISGEVPVTLSTLQGNKFRVIAQVVERTINEVRVVARREAGLDTPETYFGAKKRKLATSFGGGPEFFTYNFLLKPCPPPS
jgi:ABC-type nitrate/sulfonate/bicarbonate transport system substrate-binding protein